MLRNSIGLLAVFFISMSSFAGDFETSLKDSKCRDAVNAHLKTLNSQNDWIRQVDIPPSTSVFRSSTSEVGKWVEVRLQKGSAPKVFSITPQATSTVEFVGGECKLEEKSVAYQREGSGQGGAQVDVPLFTDDSVKALLKSKKSGVIYVWSPGMIYSVKFFGKLEKAARELKLDFVPVVDRRTSKKELMELQKRHGFSFLSSLRLASVELEMRNLEIHYPSSLVFSNGRLSANSIVGIMNESDFKHRLEYDLKFLKPL